MSEPDSAEYRLSDEHAERIFRDAIVPQLLTGTRSSQPVVVFVAGQPGAGKSRAQASLLARLGRTDAVAVDADDLRPYHPQYEQLAQADDRTAAALTHPTAQRWVQMAIAHVLEHGYDTVVSTTFGDPSSARSLIGRFRQAGWRIEVAVVAVHEAHSRLGVLERYQRQRDEIGYGRYVPTVVQQQAYHGLPDTVRTLEREDLVDTLYVYARTGTALYDSATGQPGGAPALLAERDRSWTSEERARFTATAQRLAEALPATLHPELAAIVQRAREHLLGTAAPARAGAEELIHRAAQAFPTSLHTSHLINPAAPAVRPKPTDREPREPTRE